MHRRDVGPIRLRGDRFGVLDQRGQALGGQPRPDRFDVVCEYRGRDAGLIINHAIADVNAIGVLQVQRARPNLLGPLTWMIHDPGLQIRGVGRVPGT